MLCLPRIVSRTATLFSTSLCSSEERRDTSAAFFFEPCFEFVREEVTVLVEPEDEGWNSETSESVGDDKSRTELAALGTMKSRRSEVGDWVGTLKM